jgi:pilus assembly protein Flp/PilA
MLKLVKDFVVQEEGVTAIEYGLIAALIAIVIIAALTSSGKNLDILWDKICTTLVSAVTSAGGTASACL